MKRDKRLAAIWLLVAGFQSSVAAGGQPADYKMSLQSKAFEALATRQKMATEESEVEAASWFGKTGLPEQVERSLPRYLRRQLGQFVGEHNSLKASDLVYLGAYDDGQLNLHYWRLPARHMQQKYAYVFVDRDGQAHISLGDAAMPQP